MTLKHVTRILAIGLVGAAVAGAPRIEPKPAAEASAILTQYCVSCHNERLMTGNFAIDKLNIEKLHHNPAAWGKVVRKLRTGDMPPAGSARPSPEIYDATASWLESELDQTAQQNPGRPALR